MPFFPNFEMYLTEGVCFSLLTKFFLLIKRITKPKPTTKKLKKFFKKKGNFGRQTITLSANMAHLKILSRPQ